MWDERRTLVVDAFTRKVETQVAGRAAELLRRVETDTGDIYPLASSRSEALKRASEMFAAEGDLDQAARARIEWLVFAFRETEAFGSGNYFGPRYTRSDGNPFPDFYALPPNTHQYLKARIAATNNPLHKARYADFLWDKFRDLEAGVQSVPAYIDCAKAQASRGDGNAAFRSIRRACHLARQFKSPELQVVARDAAVGLIELMAKSTTATYIPRVAEALMGLAEILSPDQRLRLSETLEQVRASFVKSCDYHLERGILKSLRQLYKLGGDEESERKAWLAEGESYEAEGDYKSRLDGSGGGPEVAAHLYRLALTHFLNMGETGKLDALKKKMDSAYKRGPVNFAAFVETLRRSFSRGG